MIRLNITTDGSDAVRRELGILFQKMQPGGGLGKVLGRAAAGVLRDHFRRRNEVPNKLGGARTNFWSAVAAGVQNPVVEDRAIVMAVSHPAIAQKVHGGPIVPRTRKNLSIPVHAKAHGKSPRVFALLAWIPRKKEAPEDTTGYLVEGARKTISRGPRKGSTVVVPAAGGSLLYVLRRKVTQAPDPQALPAAEAFRGPLLAAGRIWLRKP